MIPSNEPNASSSSPSPLNARRRQQALELLAQYTQLLRRANSPSMVASSQGDVDRALQVATDLDTFLTHGQGPTVLGDSDLERASAIYACPPLLDLTATSARDLYLCTLLTNRDLPDSAWRALVAQYPSETRRILPKLSSLYSATSALASSLPSFLSLSPDTTHPPQALALTLTLTPLLLPRLATARLLMLHTPHLTFSLFVSKHLPALVAGAAADCAAHVELALLCVQVPGAPADRVAAVVHVLVRAEPGFEGVSEDVVVAAAVSEARVAEAVVKGGGKVARVVMDRLGIE